MMFTYSGDPAKRLLMWLVLTLAGFAGNYFSVTMFFGVDLLFGSIATLIVACLFGPLWTALSAVLSTSYTYVLWGHPYAMVIFTCEALVVGHFLRRGRQNLVLVDTGYWIAIGAPLVWLFYRYIIGMDPTASLLIVLKQSINGVFNALIAAILTAIAGLLQARRNPERQTRPSFRVYLFNLLAAVVFLPSLSLVTLDSRLEFARIEDNVKEGLDLAARDAMRHLSFWYERHSRAVNHLARIASAGPLEPSQELQVKLRIVQGSFPDFYNMYIADSTATTVAFSPPVNERGESTIGLDFSDREYYRQLKDTRQPVLSDVFLGRGGVFSPIQTISVPILSDGDFRGFVLGAVNLEQLSRMLRTYAQRRQLDLVLLDQNQNVVASSSGEFPPMEMPSWLEEGALTTRDKTFLEWQPGGQRLSAMERWKRSFYLREVPGDNGIPWTIVARSAIAPHQQSLYQTYIRNLSITAVLALLALMLANLTSRQLTSPISRLAGVTGDVPGRIETTDGILWPQSPFQEAYALIVNFRQMVETLRTNFRALQDRTRDLKASEAYARSIINSSLDIIVTVNRDREIVGFNRAAQEAFGYAPEEALGRHVNLLYADEDDGHRVHRMTVEEGRYVEEVTNRRKNGERFVCHLSASRLYDAEGKVIGVMGIFRDVTERNRLEGQVRKLSKVVEQSPVSVMITDAKGRIEYVNTKFCEITGYGPGEVLGRNPRLLRSGETPREEYQRLWRTIESGGEWHGEFHNKRKDGTLFWESALISSLKNDQGGITHFLAIKEDITERKKTEERAQRQDRLAAVGQLAAGIAHDFNNLLTVMMGTAQMARMQENLPERLKEDMQIIYDQGQRAAHLVKQILDFSRKTVVERQPVDLVPFLKESAKMLQRTLPESIHIATGSEQEAFLVEANLTQLQQVLTNLSVNARDAMPDGGTLSIRISKWMPEAHESPPFPQMEAGEWIVWQVADSGCGMSPEVRAHIFEPFYTTKRIGEGTGLGLAQVYGIIKQHGGEIDVVSVPGEGASFTIYLPVSKQPEAIPNVAGPAVPRGNRETVLIVEDDPNVLKVAKVFVEHFKYQVVTAPNGREALDLYGRLNEQISLVLTDMVMPEMGGADLFEALKEQQPDIKLVFMTGYSPGMEKRTDLIRQASGFLAKPLVLDRVGEALYEAMQQKAAT